MGWWGKLKKFGHKVWGGVKKAYHKVKKFWHKHGGKIKKIWHGVKRGLRKAGDSGVPYVNTIAAGMGRAEEYGKRAKGIYEQAQGKYNKARAHIDYGRKKYNQARGAVGGGRVVGYNAHARKHFETKDHLVHTGHYKKNFTSMGISPKTPYKRGIRKRKRTSSRAFQKRPRTSTSYPIGF